MSLGIRKGPRHRGIAPPSAPGPWWPPTSTSGSGVMNSRHDIGRRSRHSGRVAALPRPAGLTRRLPGRAPAPARRGHGHHRRRRQRAPARPSPGHPPAARQRRRGPRAAARRGAPPPGRARPGGARVGREGPPGATDPGHVLLALRAWRRRRSAAGGDPGRGLPHRVPGPGDGLRGAVAAAPPGRAGGTAAGPRGPEVSTTSTSSVDVRPIALDRYGLVLRLYATGAHTRRPAAVLARRHVWLRDPRRLQPAAREGLAAEQGFSC